MEKYTTRKVDSIQQTSEVAVDSPNAEYNTTASTALSLGMLAMKFAEVDRVPRYNDERRENDAEHSYMLALVANELAQTLYPASLNAGLVTQFCIVHDLIEIETGDVATFAISDEDLAIKAASEHDALERMLDRLPPHTRTLLYEYEKQEIIEARFVKAVDKLLPVIVDILGPGRRVMIEDYNVRTIDELAISHAALRKRMADRFSEFPQVVDDHAVLSELFELEFGITQQY